jgi:hypothetical protein
MSHDLAYVGVGMDGWDKDERIVDRGDAMSAAGPPLPRTIRRIVREELEPLIELVDALRAALMQERQERARTPVTAADVPVGSKEGAQG